MDNETIRRVLHLSDFEYNSMVGYRKFYGRRQDFGGCKEIPGR